MTERYSTPYNLQQKFVAILFYMMVTLVFLSVPAVVSAFPVETHASSSKLASGQWVRVSVTSTGMHCIPDATLRSWGFTDPSKVRVYGYGGNRLPEVLDSKTYMDDLPQTPSEYVAGRGVFFYALGPTTWMESANGMWRPAHNPYSSAGYYFLTADGEGSDAPRRQPEVIQLSLVGKAMTTFPDRLYHEKDLVSLGEAGFMLVGEDFRYQANQKFDFTLAGLDTSEEEKENIQLEFSFVSATLLGEGRMSLSANGSALEMTPRDTIARISPKDSYTHGVQKLLRKSCNSAGEKLSVGVGFTSHGTIRAAHLDYIAVNYRRRMELPASRTLTIYMDERGDASLGNAGADTRVWDVTDPAAVTVMETRTADGRMLWGSRSAKRVYAAWDPAGTYPSPALVGHVAPQNLHALPVPDMVIFTPDEWKSEAERLADFHRADPVSPLNVIVLTPQAVYNEFSSGTPDAQAFRKCLKMFYDRTVAASGNTAEGAASEGSLRYALFMSRPTYDSRRLTTTVAALNYPMLPAWCTDRGLSDNDSYNSDDIIAFLADGSGSNLGNDKLSVAIGRLPITSLSDAKGAVDKILSYVNNAPTGLWRNNVVILADDGNNNRHLSQSESMCRNMEASFAAVPGAGAIYKKIYIDAYEKISNTYPDARNELYRTLDEGALLWGFIGHANPSSLTAERLVTYTDLNSFYLRHWPMVYAATCDFMRWDSTTTSGAEILFKNHEGGVISVISATRPVFISNNGYFTESFGNEFFRRGSDGNMRPIGDIYRDSKNNLKSSSGSGDTNKLRYVLLGDPAMRLVYPNNLVTLDEVGDKAVVPADGKEEPVQLMARQTTTMRGTVTDPAGNRLDDFNGTLTITLYDADESVTSNGYTVDNETSKKMTFDKLGGRLYLGSALVRNGEYELTVSMPAEVANNYRQATLNMYALADDGRQANGVCRDLYVYGMDENSLPDNQPPVIEAMYLNHPTFKDGQRVNSAPMLLATISDDRAINLSVAGLGHQMSLYLDEGAASYTDVSEYFTPNTDGTPGGTIAYPLSGLSAGAHSLRLRVWDTAPNSAEATLNFTVADGIAPTIHDVYTDRNPVSESANFYVSHDRPDQTVTVTIEVFDLMGRRVWSQTRTSRSDMFTSSPMTWDLTDSAGRRVGRGIYLYRAIVSDDDSGEKSATASRKLAVTGG